MLYSKTMNIKYETDVFIAGGGPSGVAAGVAAAKSGKNVFIAESSGCFGGLGTTGLVPAFAPFDDGENIVASGIGYAIKQKLERSTPLRNWTTIDTEELKRVYDQVISDAGIDFSFFTTLYDVICTDGHVDYVILGSKSGLFAVKAKIYIDCTGDGDLCAYGGGEFEIGDDSGVVMPPTLCSMWTNLDKETCKKEAANKHVEEAFRDGVLTFEDRHVPGFFHGQKAISGGNIGHTFGINPIDERSLTKGMLWGRKSMLEFEKYFKTYFEGYDSMQLCATAPILGVRESRRIVCDYMLDVNDFINKAQFPDEIGRYCYPVDIHVMNTNKEEYERFSKEYHSLRYKKGESYGIPYRSLIPVSFSNVLVAGRCIGTDRQMQASIRVMPGCFITGQAAGTAAALACDSEDVRNISVKQLQENLKAIGAYLPNVQ